MYNQEFIKEIHMYYLINREAMHIDFVRNIYLAYISWKVNYY